MTEQKFEKVTEWNNFDETVFFSSFITGMGVGGLISDFWFKIVVAGVAVGVYLISSYITRNVYWRKI